MHALEVVVVVGVLVLVGSLLARWVRLPPPLVLLALGTVVGFLPGVGGVEMPPDVVLFLFLPALLYWESLTISLRQIRADLRVISLMSVGLVLVTAGTVAVVGHALGLSWPMAFVLGAVLAPTDATAIATVAGLLPRRARTLLRAESLVNDGTALVVFGVAVGVAVGTLDVGPGGVAWRLVGSYAGGIAVGLALAFAVTELRRRLTDVRLENVVGVLTPFVAYLPAELLHASGVVAVVTCGLTLTQIATRVVSPAARVQAAGFWSLTTFLLNGSLFVLVGLELHAVVEGRTAGEIWTGVVATLWVALTVAGTRLVWGNTLPFVIRALDRRPAQRLRRVGFRGRLPGQWAGFRGAVSLAAALAVPTTTAAGGPLEGRDLVLLVTFGVIVVLLVVQGLTLPAVIRFSRLQPDPAEAQEELLAQREALGAAQAALDVRAAELGVPEAVVARVREAHEARERQLHLTQVLSDGRVTDPDHRAAKKAVLAEAESERRLRLALLGDKRDAVVRLRDLHAIDDLVLRRVMAQLDAEEVRLVGVQPEE
ncbi:Na+/H+ antiporter [Klenkia taihuensis]|uniref:Monovalent cation:H+ antiporter, CPA1 family n=1 Tax=Klenkia taihuensis TaxID=1225127 RepID=A0A1I1GJ21_9ACTN|nr:Na+/H+ antiporter [Klenkia taihuensis]GHE09707.1 putative Na(+)/H(+) exchanger [Klenkia taihuensis]SFC11779.1 monovalent cation:H+ antiporter, CPA1 family [Klenkia taihuensis]